MLLSALICVMAFAMFYYAFVLPNPDIRPVETISSLSASSKDTGFLSLGKANGKDIVLTARSGNCIDWHVLLSTTYFSAVTFTTLGYGDIQPTGWVRLLAMIEASLGAFLMALFVFSFTRKHAQR